MIDFVGVGPKEWVAGYFLLLGLAVTFGLGFHLLTLFVILAVVALTGLAAVTCSQPDFSYWRGLAVIASVNLTGEVILGSVVTIPLLAAATTLSWAFGLIGVCGGRAWARRHWFRFLRHYWAVARRVSIKS